MAKAMKAMMAAASAAMKAAKVMKKAAMKRTMKAAAPKAMKPMKAMKKKASKIAKGRLGKVQVFRGTKAKTRYGLTKAHLIKNKKGKIVTEKSSAVHKLNYQNGVYSGFKEWAAAVQKARAALGIVGFVAITKGSALYNKAKEFYQ